MVKRVWKRLIAVLLLVVMTFSLCGCESDLERAERNLREAERNAAEKRQEANEAQEKVRILETLLGY